MGRWVLDRLPPISDKCAVASLQIFSGSRISLPGAATFAKNDLPEATRWPLNKCYAATPRALRSRTGEQRGLIQQSPARDFGLWTRFESSTSRRAIGVHRGNCAGWRAL